MSLISLTFGKDRQSFSSELISISTPMDNVKVNPHDSNTVKVRKVCQFLGDKNLYLVCEVVSGAICEHMVGNYEGKSLELLEIDSKYPHSTLAKKGMSVGLTVKGLCKGDIRSGEELNFNLKQ